MDFQITSLNVEGLSPAKAEILSSLNTDILCVQETHKDVALNIPGLYLIIHHGSNIHGSAIYARDKSIILNSQDMTESGVEILKIESTHFNVISVYKPPPTPFHWPLQYTTSEKPLVVIGDFNSHSTKWGYSDNNNDGDAVEEWSDQHNITLLHDAKDKPSFSSARWKRGYNPDLVFVSSRHLQNFQKVYEYSDDQVL